MASTKPIDPNDLSVPGKKPAKVARAKRVLKSKSMATYEQSATMSEGNSTQFVPSDTRGGGMHIPVQPLQPYTSLGETPWRLVSAVVIPWTYGEHRVVWYWERDRT